LCGFLEISALSIAHAQTGGTQYKGGFLKIEAAGRGGGFGRKGTGWKDKKESRWCAIRESYLVVSTEPGAVSTSLRHRVFYLTITFSSIYGMSFYLTPTLPSSDPNVTTVKVLACFIQNLIRKKKKRVVLTPDPQ
jgi:hypothetical protein